MARPLYTAHKIRLDMSVTYSKKELREKLLSASSNIKQAAKATVKAAGDGTTTSTVLAHAIFKKGSESEQHIESIHKFKKSMDAAVVDLVNIIGSRSSQLKTFAQIESVATISANNDKELGSLIASAFAEAGTYGTVVVRPANAYKTS